MAESVSLLNMFALYQPPEELASLLSQAAVVAADIDPERGNVEVCVHSERYIPARVIRGITGDICNIYGLRHLDIVTTHPAHQLQSLEPEELRDLFIAHNSMNRGALAGAQWSWGPVSPQCKAAAALRGAALTFPAQRQGRRGGLT